MAHPKRVVNLGYYLILSRVKVVPNEVARGRGKIVLARL